METNLFGDRAGARGRGTDAPPAEQSLDLIVSCGSLHRDSGGGPSPLGRAAGVNGGGSRAPGRQRLQAGEAWSCAAPPSPTWLLSLGDFPSPSRRPGINFSPRGAPSCLCLLAFVSFSLWGPPAGGAAPRGRAGARERALSLASYCNASPCVSPHPTPALLLAAPPDPPPRGFPAPLPALHIPPLPLASPSPVSSSSRVWTAPRARQIGCSLPFQLTPEPRSCRQVPKREHGWGNVHVKSKGLVAALVIVMCGPG
ncbi:unnamed protein product [Caretta caretta]